MSEFRPTPPVAPNGERMSLPPENLSRGILFAIIVVPLGIVAWDILWSVGFVASIVAFGVAWGAMRLYRLGSGGRITRSGAIALTVITIVTLVLAFVSGFAVDLVGLFGRESGQSVAESLTDPRFWNIVGLAMTQGSSLVSLLLAILFGALGSFGVLRSAFRQTRTSQSDPAQPAPTHQDPMHPDLTQPDLSHPDEPGTPGR